MKIALYILIAGFLLFLVSFFLMGRGSVKGDALGMIDGKLAPCSAKPNCVSSETGTDPKKLVTPFNGTDMSKVKAAITAMGGVVTSETQDYLSATFTSKIFKFVDDVEIRMDGTTAHIRSASRAGYSDRGVNKARVDALRLKVNG